MNESESNVGSTQEASSLHSLVSRLSALSAEGTIRITVKAAGRGFHMTFYAATKPFQLDGRDLAGMVGDAEKIQAANQIISEE